MKIVFLGSADFSVPTLVKLIDAGHEIACIYSQPPRRAGRGQKVKLTPVHEMSLKFGIPVRTPENFELGDGMYYNLWIEGNQIAMPQPLYDESVEYDDKTPNDLEQLSRDLVTFLAWAAEPELEERKNLGIKVILFFILFGFLVFLAKIRLWREIN